MDRTVIYVSKCTSRSLWQEYRIREDRLEFDTHLGQMTIPFAQVESVTVVESNVKGLLRGDLQLRNFRPAIKLDWANFLEHVVLDKCEGWLRRILFTPDDPAAFKLAFDAAFERFRKKAGPAREV